eukprot:5428328-Prymnesium_polylepis.1
MKKPPKVYNPSVYPLDGAIKRFTDIWTKNGFNYAYNKARMESTFRIGYLVGTDANGNKYYEQKDAPYSEPRRVKLPTPAPLQD